MDLFLALLVHPSIHSGGVRAHVHGPVRFHPFFKRAAY